MAVRAMCGGGAAVGVCSPGGGALGRALGAAAARVDVPAAAVADLALWR